jgi:hypothetical protein
MEFIISPYKGIGPIKFGMTREEVRRLIAEEFKVLAGIELWDSFERIGIQVCYSFEPPHICEVVLLESTQTASFLNKQLLGEESMGDLHDWLKTIDEDVEFDGEDITTYKFGFSLCRQVEDYSLFQLPPEALACFREGYYDFLRVNKSMD